MLMDIGLFWTPASVKDGNKTIWTKKKKKEMWLGGGGTHL